MLQFTFLAHGMYLPLNEITLGIEIFTLILSAFFIITIISLILKLKSNFNNKKTNDLKQLNIKQKSNSRLGFLGIYILTFSTLLIFQFIIMYFIGAKNILTPFTAFVISVIILIVLKLKSNFYLTLIDLYFLIFGTLLFFKFGFPSYYNSFLISFFHIMPPGSLPIIASLWLVIILYLRSQSSIKPIS